MIDTTPMYAKLWGSSRVRHSLTPKHLSQDAALDLLRKPGHLLTKTGRDFFIVPGGSVTETFARRILERPDMQPQDCGLLEGHAQSWRLGPAPGAKAPPRNSSARRVSAPAAALPANRGRSNENIQQIEKSRRRPKCWPAKRPTTCPAASCAKSSGTGQDGSQEAEPGGRRQRPARPGPANISTRWRQPAIVGRMIKFGKEGQFVTPDDGEPIAVDAEFVALCEQTLVGRIKFNGDGEPPDRIMGLLYDGFVMPPRESLGDLDESQWPIGLDNLPADLGNIRCTWCCSAPPRWRCSRSSHRRKQVGAPSAIFFGTTIACGRRTRTIARSFASRSAASITTTIAWDG